MPSYQSSQHVHMRHAHADRMRGRKTTGRLAGTIMMPEGNWRRLPCDRCCVFLDGKSEVWCRTLCQALTRPPPRHPATTCYTQHGVHLSQGKSYEQSKESKRVYQFADTSLLRKLTCHMESHSVSCHPAEVTFPPLSQPIKAGTKFVDPKRMKRWVGLVGWPVADGLPLIVVIHQLQVESRTGKVRRPQTDVLPLSHATSSKG